MASSLVDSTRTVAHFGVPIAGAFQLQLFMEKLVLRGRGGDIYRISTIGKKHAQPTYSKRFVEKLRSER
jgi:TctA family transporter